MPWTCLPEERGICWVRHLINLRQIPHFARKDSRISTMYNYQLQMPWTCLPEERGICWADNQSSFGRFLTTFGKTAAGRQCKIINCRCLELSSRGTRDLLGRQSIILQQVPHFVRKDSRHSAMYNNEQQMPWACLPEERGFCWADNQSSFSRFLTSFGKTAAIRPCTKMICRCPELSSRGRRVLLG